jgi:DNA ligase-1
MLEADLASAVQRAFAGTLGDARMRLFHPLGFMLASPVDSPEEAVERFSGKQQAETAIEAFLEDKYDGMRAQIHCGDVEQPGRVAIYSRNRDDVTESFPDLAEAFASVREPLIFDGEILGWELKAGHALPFAVLGQRIGRKRVTNEWRQQVPVIFMAFDLMYAGGELILKLPLSERRNRLEAVVERLVEMVRSPLTVDERKDAAQSVMFLQPDGDGVERLMISPSRLVESAEDIERAYADARARANEGVMLKAAASEYQPGRRGLAWVKLKRELATLDVVVTGAEFGHGKRAGILSDYTFAVRGAGGELLNVGKAYSGLTDAEIAELSAWMMEHTLEDQGYFRTVEPLMVLEVAFNNIMRSGRHASGFALRFPRIIRIRTDKPVSEIDTVARVEEVYQSQVDKPVEA